MLWFTRHCFTMKTISIMLLLHVHLNVQCSIQSRILGIYTGLEINFLCGSLVATNSRKLNLIVYNSHTNMNLFVTLHAQKVTIEELRQLQRALSSGFHAPMIPVSEEPAETIWHLVN